MTRAATLTPAYIEKPCEDCAGEGVATDWEYVERRCETCDGRGTYEAMCDGAICNAHAVIEDDGEHYCRSCAIDYELIAFAPVTADPRGGVWA